MPLALFPHFACTFLANAGSLHPNWDSRLRGNDVLTISSLIVAIPSPPFS
jgi:hypothetical protein